MNFQEMILTLQQFWGKHGCVIGQPYGVEVGAGTGNPNTFFRILGPEPFAVAYVEPARRPQDGRYGMNPNRFQHFFQFQVILKPAPAYNQELYIESLMALGISPEKHDIRFVEDNWESTPLGAWGLGWEVWVDGMEVTQYTYFQQSARIPLEVTPLEITYGLERLAMYIQNVDDYRQLMWNDTVRYADLFERHEYYQSSHNYETSSPEILNNLYAEYNKAVKKQLEKPNYWAAYDYLLKLSHIFNLLDARGLVSVTDRVTKFADMGKYANQIGKQYLDDRKELGYPLKSVQFINYKPKIEAAKVAPIDKKVTVVEMLFEEIPATYLIGWSKTLNTEYLKSVLSETGFTFTTAELNLTPRRIILRIDELSEEGRVEAIVNGPPKRIAFDTNGNPTKALSAFLEKNNIEQSRVEVKTENNEEFICAKITKAKTIEEILNFIVSQIVLNAPPIRTMNLDSGETFIRPLRKLLAFTDSVKHNISALGVTSSNTTLAPRYYNPTEYTVSSAQEYLQLISELGIVPNGAERLKTIMAPQYRIPTTQKSFAMEDVFLTEHPNVLTDVLPAQYKEIPRAIRNYILHKNQRYLTPDDDNSLEYHIIANHNSLDTDGIKKGNAKVAIARLEDGLFYLHNDTKISLRALKEKLKNIAYHPKLGSYSDKADRVIRIARALFRETYKTEVSHNFDVFSELYKNDRATELVREFPDFEGYIGARIAKIQGEGPEVIVLLNESAYPNNRKPKRLPRNNEAVIVSISNIIDSIVAITSVEKLPTGSHDPYEIRKLTYRLLYLLRKTKLNVSVNHLLLLADKHLEGEARETPLDAVSDYILSRYAEILINKKQIPYEVAYRVAKTQNNSLPSKLKLARVISALSPEIRTQFFDSLKRLLNILAQGNKLGFTVNPENSVSPNSIETEIIKEITSLNFTDPSTYSRIAQVLEKLFAEVRVFSDDKLETENHLGVIARILGIVEEYCKAKID